MDDGTRDKGQEVKGDVSQWIDSDDQSDPKGTDRDSNSNAANKLPVDNLNHMGLVFLQYI